MSAPEDRREAPRILTDFSLVLLDDAGLVLDDRAFAHDVSDKGLKAETQAPLTKGQTVRFRVAIRGEEIAGLAKIVWLQRTDMAHWAGLSFIKLPWAQKRKLRGTTRPGDTPWESILDKAITALVLLLLTVISWSALTSPVWRQILPSLLPKAAAAIVMGLALRELLSPRR